MKLWLYSVLHSFLGWNGSVLLNLFLFRSMIWSWFHLGPVTYDLPSHVGEILLELLPSTKSSRNGQVDIFCLAHCFWFISRLLAIKTLEPPPYTSPGTTFWVSVPYFWKFYLDQPRFQLLSYLPSSSPPISDWRCHPPSHQHHFFSSYSLLYLLYALQPPCGKNSLLSQTWWLYTEGHGFWRNWLWSVAN